MKKNIRLFMVLLLLFIMVAPVSTANSMPVYMEGHPSFNILALEDCPIVVVNETLEFDFSESERMNWGWSPIARVTASYRMQNPGTEQETITMAFPSVMSLLAGESFTKITVDGHEIPFTTLLADNVNYIGSNENSEQFRQAASMENILEQLNREPYEPQNFDKNGTAALYRFSTNEHSEHDERRNLIISFSLDPKRTTVAVSDSFGYSAFEDGSVELFAWIERDFLYRAEPWMLVLGEDTIRDLRMETYEGGFKENPVHDAEAAYEKEIVEVNSFLSEQISLGISRHQLGIPEVNDYEEPVFRWLDEWFEYSLIVTLYDAISVLYQLHLVVFLYDVTFPAGSMTEVTVQYTTDGTMDRRNSKNPMYTYAYISNPARGFAGFGGIDVVIRPPAETPYILSSTWPFERDDDGIYTASFDALPDDDLLFTIYSAPELSGPPVFIIGAIILLTGAAVIIVIKKLKSRRERNNTATKKLNNNLF